MIGERPPKSTDNLARSQKYRGMILDPMSRLFPRVLAWVLLPALLLAAVPASVSADFFSTTPGPLSQGHANLDNKDHCTDCHVDGRKVSREKCIACHQPIADRQRDGKGLHANQKAMGRPCELCHVEHKGRGKDVMGWSAFGGKEHFEHNTYTAFPLDGKHKDVTCNKCHTQKTGTGTQSFIKAPSMCASCHQNPHGDLHEPMRKCERCHDARSWKMIDKPVFDHDKDARYPLEKKHQDVTCARCHAKGGAAPPSSKATAGAIAKTEGGYTKMTFRWASWSTDCTPCHENVHGASLFGQKSCKLCHSAKAEWAKTFFDHNRRTKFPLDGAHGRKATCDSCHKKDEKKAPDRACISCHVDAHKGRFSKYGSSGQANCGTCHTANVWKPENKFDHNSMTRFTLTGAHAGADCRACHRGKNQADWEHLENLVTKEGKKALVVDCMGCHRHATAHQKQYTNDRCLECHKMAGIVDTKPRAVNEFHGPNSKFPLTEGHRNVDCAKCHAGGIFKGAPDQCGPKCHADELHKGSLGQDCVICHAGGKWEARLFDHDKHTSWPLVGNHKDVLCDSCHPRRDFAGNRGKSRTCYNCHKKDDPHDGELGTRCERCHIPDGSIIFEHNNPKVSDWPLRGKHADVRCQDCHKSIRFKPTAKDCNGCHGEPDVHRGQLGTLCGRCHEEKTWKTVRTQHDVPAIRFAGAHDRVTCYKCHTQGRLLEGTGQLCITCHKNDDIHHNALGPRCAECHSQTTWAGARFDHNTVGCNLTGIHRLQPCVSCHVGGNFTAISPTCASCHRQDAVRGATDSNPIGKAHAFLPTCANCHNSNRFNNAKTDGSTAGRRESVCQ